MTEDHEASQGTQEYWFNSRTNQVETGKQSVAIYRIGPFKSYEDAAKANELLASRSREWQIEEDSER